MKKSFLWFLAGAATMLVVCSVSDFRLPLQAKTKVKDETEISEPQTPREALFDGEETYNWEAMAEFMDNMETISTEEYSLEAYARPYGQGNECADWQSDTVYRVEMRFSEALTGVGKCSLVDVDYPADLKAGETATITVTLKTEEGAVLTGECEITAVDDLHLIHGSSNPEVNPGNNVELWDFGLVTVDFYTSRTLEYLESHGDFLVSIGGDGAYIGRFHRY